MSASCPFVAMQKARAKLVVRMQAHKVTSKTITAPKVAAPPARGAAVDRRAVLLGLIASTQLLPLDLHLTLPASATDIETVSRELSV